MTTPKPALENISRAQQRQCSNLYNFYTEGEMVDTTVEVMGFQVRLHKIVLAAHSPVFRAMFQSGMMETRTNHIKINDVEPATFQQIVHYLYNGFCPDLSRHHVEIFKFADKYDLVELAEMCEDMSSSCRDVNNAVEYLILAEMLCRDTMKNEVLDFMKPRIRFIVQQDNWVDLSLQLKTALALKYSQNVLSPVEYLIHQDQGTLTFSSQRSVNWNVDGFCFVSGNPVSSPRFHLTIKGEVVSFCFTFCRYKQSQSPIQITLLSRFAAVPLSISGTFVLHGVRRPHSSVDKTITWTQADIDAPSYVVPRRKNVMSVNMMNSGLEHAIFSSTAHVKFSFTVADSSTSRLKNHKPEQILSLQPYLNSGRFSDVTFQVDGQTFFGHRLILAALCPVFERIFRLPGHKYQITGVTANDFHVVLRYLYNNELPDPKTVEGSTLNTADICELDELFDHCERALLSEVRVESAVKTLITSHKLRACRLKNRAKFLIKHNLRTVSDQKSWNKLEEHPDLFNELLFDLASVCPLIPDDLNPPENSPIC
uniref:Speckle-type POZ protein n=2 Tax=Lygus hesperus TaxID=30085 RepID=A0A0A9Z067_LYGHE